jgi:hypothetical protein
MKMKYLYLLIIIGLVISCDIKKSNMSPDTNFTRVYTDNNSSHTYYPVDVVETDDNGFLIVSGLYDSDSLNYPKVHLLKTNKEGDLEWTYTSDPSILSPTPSILEVSGSYYLVCMENNLDANLYEINMGSTESSMEFVKEMGVTNPLYAYKDDNGNVTLLSYDIPGTLSVITGYDGAFTQQWSTLLSAITDVQYNIRYHLNKEGKEYPFYIGEIMTNNLITHYYVNCYNNSTLSTNFINVADGTFEGVLNTYTSGAGISSFVHLQENRFALSRYYTGKNFIYPDVEVDISGISNTDDFTGSDIELPELVNDARVAILKDHFNDEELVLYASTTKTNQIVLYFFSPETSELVKTHYLGFTNPVEVAAIKRGSDGSVIILGRTWVAGRFQRIILYKISMDELGF